MAEYEIIAQKIGHQLHAALLQDRRLIDLYVDCRPEYARWSSIYLGKVDKIDKGLNGAFVSLGGSQTGFLPAKHVLHKGVSAQDANIETLLSPGQMILVQVKSEGKRKSDFENEKHPRLTMKLYLPGRILFYTPYGNTVKAPENLKSDRVEKIANELRKHGGWYFHGEIEHTESAEVKAEAKNLLAVWRDIKSACENSSQTPRMLYQGPNAIQRLLIDYRYLKIDYLEVSEDSNPSALRDWLAHHAPYLAEAMTISSLHKIDLFETRDIYGSIEDILTPYVALPSGGGLIIESTHALSVVDVNRGDGDDNLRVNQEAAIEVAKQLRLRNLSGAILVDFIGMQRKSERYALMRRLQACVERDPGNVHVHGFTRLGIMELTRTRRTATLYEKSDN